ncbi:hypothetical protein CEXT_229101 [Caerostris extrusa]|uniref:Uncharacterized protein n=1 Tax=Caerostris extrusa TaxID=172846 RepID=A0AAV4SWS3_CAEEX|nr:hypothetical protein CEXT_229101 [Caerostris extrusa]
MTIILIAVLLIIVPEPNESGKVSLCIHNCAQCKRTFGPFLKVKDVPSGVSEFKERLCLTVRSLIQLPISLPN